MKSNANDGGDHDEQIDKQSREESFIGQEVFPLWGIGRRTRPSAADHISAISVAGGHGVGWYYYLATT